MAEAEAEAKTSDQIRPNNKEMGERSASNMIASTNTETSVQESDKEKMIQAPPSTSQTERVPKPVAVEASSSNMLDKPFCVLYTSNFSETEDTSSENNADQSSVSKMPFAGFTKETPAMMLDLAVLLSDITIQTMEMGKVWMIGIHS